MKVYVLMYVNNNYDQPEKAFSQLFFNKPTKVELSKEMNLQINSSTESKFESILKGDRIYDEYYTEYWLEEFKKWITTY